jgi:hypothetical protein
VSRLITIEASSGFLGLIGTRFGGLGSLLDEHIDSSLKKVGTNTIGTAGRWRGFRIFDRLGGWPSDVARLHLHLVSLVCQHHDILPTKTFPNKCGLLLNWWKMVFQPYDDLLPSLT